MAVKDLTKEEQKAVFITGDYKTLKEFADQEDINYACLRQYGNGWLSQKKEHIKHICSKVIAECAENTIETKISEIETRQSETLNLCNKMRAKAATLLKTTTSEKGLNALASTLYRINEVESNLLGYSRPSTDEEAISNANEFLVSVKEAADYDAD